MKIFLTYMFLFLIGSVFGWILEVIFRRFISDSNPEREWINPGFCTGPYLPLYGCGLCILYALASVEKFLTEDSVVLNKLFILVFMAVSMTGMEYIAGIINLRVTKVRLWDYSNEWGNIQGVICPKFTLAWTVLGALYYFLLHPHISAAAEQLALNPLTAFFSGCFLGVFLVDVLHAAQLVVKMKKYAEENQIVIRYELLKVHIREQLEKNKEKYYFFRPFKSEKPLSELLRDLQSSFEKLKKNKRK